MNRDAEEKKLYIESKIADIKKLFLAGSSVTVIIRHPTDITRDVLITEDSTDEIFTSLYAITMRT